MPADSAMFVNSPRSEKEAMDILIDCVQKSDVIAGRTNNCFRKDTKAISLLNELAKEGYVVYVKEVFVEGADADYWDEEAERIGRMFKTDAADDAVSR